MHFGPGLDPLLSKRIFQIARIQVDPKKGAELDFQDPDEALAESVAILLEGIGMKFWLKRRPALGALLSGLRGRP
jgi:hypothetical protein